MCVPLASTRTHSCTKRHIDMDANMTTLEAALEAAVNRSVTLPVSERPAFIGRCLIASHHGLEPPHSPESNITEDAAVLLLQMQELQTTLSAALNAANGQPGWPLLAVGRHLTQLADVVIAPAAASSRASPSTAITAGSMDSDAAAAAEICLRAAPRGGESATP